MPVALQGRRSRHGLAGAALGSFVRQRCAGPRHVPQCVLVRRGGVHLVTGYKDIYPPCESFAGHSFAVSVPSAQDAALPWASPRKVQHCRRRPECAEQALSCLESSSHEGRNGVGGRAGRDSFEASMAPLAQPTRLAFVALLASVVELALMITVALEEAHREVRRRHLRGPFW